MVFVGGLEADEGADGGLAVVAGGEECGRVQAVVVTRVARFGRRMPLERPRPRLRLARRPGPQDPTEGSPTRSLLHAFCLCFCAVRLVLFTLRSTYC